MERRSRLTTDDELAEQEHENQQREQEAFERQRIRSWEQDRELEHRYDYSDSTAAAGVHRDRISKKMSHIEKGLKR
jgi:hypothetical protein